MQNTDPPPGATVPPGEAMSVAPDSGWMPGPVRSALDTPLLDVTGGKLTIGALLIAVVIVIAGVLISKIVSRMLVAFFARRFTAAHPGAISAVRSLLFYALCAVAVMAALKVAQVPLGIFAVAGGALAIGVGFGSQNILNNFISGLILLIERPVRVGDIIQLDGPDTVNGVVREIGARSTRIVTGENVELVVPNSTLLQHNVVNWTLADDEIRASVTVGIAYGSNLQKARELLLDTAINHGLVLKAPAPVVLCEEFGDNAIVLRLYFWMRVRRAFERRTVESDLRFMVEKVLRHAGITIAFPQRDVHLFAASPVPVRVTEA